MSIEYRGGGKYRFRMRKDGINYTENYYCNKKLSQEDIKKKNWSKEVKNAHIKFKADILRGKTGYNENMKFLDLSQTVLNDYLKPNMRANTIKGYKSAMNNHILPEFGGMKTNKITKLHVQKFINEKSKALKPSTVATIHREMNKTFNKGIEWGLLQSNPCKGIKLPRDNKTNYSELLSAEDIKKLSEAIDEQKLLYKAFFSIGLYAGLRESEILGLTLSDIDFKDNVITVNKQFSYVLDGDERKKDITDTKSKNSIRKVYMPNVLTHVLKEYIDSMKVISKDGYLFFNHKTGKMHGRTTFTKEFSKMLKAYKIPHIRFHDTRHLCATLNINAGTNVLTVAKSLGDTVQTVLDNYAHSISEEQKKASRTFDKYIKNL